VVTAGNSRGLTAINSNSLTKTINAAGLISPASTQVWNTAEVSNSGTRFQIGTDGTEVTRDDVNIGAAFTVGLQASPFAPSGLGGFNSTTGIAQTSGNVVTSTSGGIIEECALFGDWRATDSAKHLFMLAHDNILPNVTFLAGQTVNVEYSFQL
jgi:hypothetical protein